jgi:hypothetical protein
VSHPTDLVGLVSTETCKFTALEGGCQPRSFLSSTCIYSAS